MSITVIDRDFRNDFNKCKANFKYKEATDIQRLLLSKGSERSIQDST